MAREEKTYDGDETRKIIGVQRDLTEYETRAREMVGDVGNYEVDQIPEAYQEMQSLLKKMEEFPEIFERSIAHYGTAKNRLEVVLGRTMKQLLENREKDPDEGRKELKDDLPF